MTTTASATAAPIRVAVPPPRVLRLINPLVAALLRSPFHRLLSREVLLLTFTGRRSGRRITIPVGYTREGDTLTLFSTRSWWQNLRGGAAVAVRLAGRPRTARATPTDDRAAVSAEVQRYIDQYGARKAGRRIGIALDPACPPAPDELLSDLPHLAVIRLALDPL